MQPLHAVEEATLFAGRMSLVHPDGAPFPVEDTGLALLFKGNTGSGGDCVKDGDRFWIACHEVSATLPGDSLHMYEYYIVSMSQYNGVFGAYRLLNQYNSIAKWRWRLCPRRSLTCPEVCLISICRRKYVDVDGVLVEEDF
jgi:hypothetical protein